MHSATDMIRIFLMAFFIGSVITAQAGRSSLRADNDNTTKEMDQALLDRDLTDFFVKQSNFIESPIDFNKIRNLHINFLVFVKALIGVTAGEQISMTVPNGPTVILPMSDIPRVSKRVVTHFNNLFAYIARQGFVDTLIGQQFSSRYIPAQEGGEWLLPSFNILTNDGLLDIFIEKKSAQLFGIYQTNVLWSAALSRLVNTDSWSVENQLAYDEQRRIVEKAYTDFNKMLSQSAKMRQAYAEYANKSMYINSGVLLEENVDFQKALKPNCMQLLK